MWSSREEMKWDLLGGQVQKTKQEVRPVTKKMKIKILKKKG